MKARALAGDYAASTANLESIARHYAGADVRIQWQPATTWLGLARRTTDGAEILINPAAPAARLGHILFHELGHLCSGHCEIVSTRSPADLADDDTAALLERLTPAEKAAIGPVIDAKENEADRWAETALRKFEGRFGPFLKAIR